MRTLLAVSFAVFISASVSAVRAVDISKAPVKFQTILDPVASGCVNPRIDTEQSGVYLLEDGRYGVYVLFHCGEKV